MDLTPEERRQGIGGSDVGAIMGANPYCSPVQIYREKIGELDPPDFNYAMKWGHILERPAALDYAVDNGYEFTDETDGNKHFDAVFDRFASNPNQKGLIFKPNQYRSGWQYAHPDFLVYTKRIQEYMSAPLNSDDDPYILHGVEVKTVSEGIYKKYWLDGGVPPWQYYQVVWYSMLSGIDTWDFVGFVPHIRNKENPIVVHRVVIDKETKQKTKEVVSKFWECVQSRTPPELSGNENYKDVSKLYPEDPGSIIQSNNNIDESIARLKLIRDELKELEDEQDTLKGQVVAYMKQCSVLVNEAGDTKLTFKQVKGGSKRKWEDMARFLMKHKPAHEQQELLNKFTYKTLGSRRFLLK